MSTTIRTYQALYDFTGTTSGHQLSFPAGAVLHCPYPIREDGGWLWGTYQSAEGWFPKNYVHAIALQESRIPTTIEISEPDSPVGVSQVPAPIHDDDDEGFGGEILGGDSTAKYDNATTLYVADPTEIKTIMVEPRYSTELDENKGAKKLFSKVKKMSKRFRPKNVRVGSEP